LHIFAVIGAWMPYRIDLFAIFIFLGIVQAFFLSIFFFSKENRKNQANIFYGLLLISMGLCLLEIFLMYTGYIVHCLFLVDFSEPLSFMLGPSFYLMVLSVTRGRLPRKYLLHFAFAAFYLILVLPFFLLPEEVKYNSWIESYRLDIPLRPYDYERDPRLFWVTDNHTLLTIVSIVVYALLSLLEVFKIFRAKNESFFKPANYTLKGLRNGTLQIIFTTLMLLVIKYFNPNDSGDHIFAAYIGISIYFVSFRVMQQSGFFRQATLEEPQKYKSSSLSEDQRKNILDRMQTVMVERKPFLKPDFSLPDLAEQVGTTVHMLSQVINASLGKSFFEMTAEYRVNEAKRLLKERRNVKVEEIAEQVGYNSKSSFNNAFKRITGQTPSDYRARS
jgi:AraC-like DNA-binding protein